MSCAPHRVTVTKTIAPNAIATAFMRTLPRSLASDELVAIHVRQRDVGDDDLRPALEHQLARGQRVLGLQYLVARLGQVQVEKRARVGRVFEQKDDGHDAPSCLNRARLPPEKIG